jgi:transposase-like protein
MSPLDDGSVTTGGDAVTIAMIQALIPLGLRAVEEALQAEVAALAGPRYARGDSRPDVVRWGRQDGSIYLADQKVPVQVPRVRDRAAGREVPLATYSQLQTPRAQDGGLFRRVLGGLSCREYEAAAEAVPEAFGLAKSTVSRRFIRASARELRRLQERRLDDQEWLVLVLDGTAFAGDQIVVALGVTATGEKRILGLVRRRQRTGVCWRASCGSSASEGTRWISPTSWWSTGRRGCAPRCAMSSATRRGPRCSGVSGTSGRTS